MNKQETTKLLAMIKVAYPTAYRDMDEMSKRATVNMWHISFPDVPYSVMELAFNGFRMVSKFPPTVAEIAEQLHRIYFQAEEAAMINKQLGNGELAQRYLSVMDSTRRFRDLEQLRLLSCEKRPGTMIGDNCDVGEIGKLLGRSDRSSLGKEGEPA